MKTKKWFLAIVVFLVVAAGAADVVRYLQPENKEKVTVETSDLPRVANANEIIFVYNANGGIYPGIADIIHKSFFPKTYPCNLCFLAFGNFGKKEAWKNFLGTIPYRKTELHKDEFRRNYLPENFLLPAILISNNKETRVLVSAAEINGQHTLPDLIALVQSKL